MSFQIYQPDYISNTSVVPGKYTSATITVNQQGRIIEASDGTPYSLVGFTQTNTTQIFNTDVETDLISETVSVGIGSLMGSANTAKLGSTFRLIFGGDIKNDTGGGVNTASMKIYIGDQIINDLIMDLTNLDGMLEPWKCEADYVITQIGENGKINSNVFLWHTRGTNANIKGVANNVLGADIDTTTNNDLKITITWNSAKVDNDIRCNLFASFLLFNPPS